MTEGVDYSRTAHGNWPQLAAALKAEGKEFVGRYAVGDKSPNGRGITAAEYRAMTAAGIQTFVYWQTTTSWMLGGWAAGVSGALNAQANLLAAGMPADTPVYFACDFDASRAQLPAIDACLAGAESVLGPDRVGIYGGYTVIEHCAAAKTATWFCQTLAWMYGRGWHPSAHLHQYGFNVYIDGTNVDLVRATVENYGQAVPPMVDHKPRPGKITWDTTKETGIVTYKGDDILVGRAKVVCTRAANLYTGASKRGKIVGKTEVGTEYVCVGSTASGWLFLELEPGVVPRAVRSAFRPLVPRPQDFKEHRKG